MGAPEDRYKDIDQNIAANLRAYREAHGISQEELAQRMADRGFGFGQATIWKIESGQRPVRASELIALTDSLGVFPSPDLTREPDATRYKIQLKAASTRAYDAYRALKDAAAAYLHAQIEVAFAAREAHDAGVTVTELDAGWLTTLPEEAVIEARVAAEHETAHFEQDNDAVNKILDALRGSGYEPVLRIEDIEYHDGGPLPAWTPGEASDAAE
jgi:transcriptional regulator with XRE-family HTH domain